MQNNKIFWVIKQELLACIQFLLRFGRLVVDWSVEYMTLDVTLYEKCTGRKRSNIHLILIRLPHHTVYLRNILLIKSYNQKLGLLQISMDAKLVGNFLMILIRVKLKNQRVSRPCIVHLVIKKKQLALCKNYVLQ
jgi:hypothetical protein